MYLPIDCTDAADATCVVPASDIEVEPAAANMTRAFASLQSICLPARAVAIEPTVAELPSRPTLSIGIADVTQPSDSPVATAAAGLPAAGNPQVDVSQPRSERRLQPLGPRTSPSLSVLVSEITAHVRTVVDKTVVESPNAGPLIISQTTPMSIDQSLLLHARPLVLIGRRSSRKCFGDDSAGTCTGDDVAIGRLVMCKAIAKIARELDVVEAADGAKVGV